ncbi:NADH-quinone oxidoreductase subunit N [Flavobacterium longum]|uniref:NADH-quinone oxidoreductase subunit N n=1 Tax=Flavobacterium longum TaxID=1299340 RepID=UPI0039E95F25
MNTLIAIIGLGIICLLMEILNARKAIVAVTVIGLLAVLGLTVAEFGIADSRFNNMVVNSKFATSFSGLFIILTLFLVLLGGDFYKAHPKKLSDYIAMKIFLLAGAVAMVSFGNLAMFFLGIEVLSIALYVLTGSNRLSLKSNEAGMKYFLMGSFASGFILFGICLIYGATGSFDVAEIYELSKSGLIPQWFNIGLGMMVIGMLFKVAAAPFHFWAPDVYEGSPSLTTALMSTLAKVVAIASLYKLVSGLNAETDLRFEWVIGIISVLSMTVGNLLALRQQNVKRMLAFSGISHAGFMLLFLLNLTVSPGTLLYYAAAYALSGIASFAVIIYVCKDKDNENIVNFNGLGKTNPVMAAVLTFALLSMAGIPIFAGFFAKFMLFTQTVEGGYLALVIAGVVNSIVSVGYYFKLILAMYTKDAEAEKQSVPVAYYIVAVVAIILNVGMGLFPSAIVDLLS